MRDLARFAPERNRTSYTAGAEAKPVCGMVRMALPLHEEASMNSTSPLQAIDDRDLVAVSGGYRPTWMFEQAINGAILGGTGGAVGGAAAGAFAGSIVPGLGTAGGFAAGTIIGGINGAAIGAVYGGVSEFKRQRRDGDTTPCYGSSSGSGASARTGRSRAACATATKTM